MKSFPFYPSVQMTQIANFLFAMLLCFHAWQTHADEVFSGLPVSPSGTAVLEHNPDGSLTVSIEDDMELGGVTISSGHVEGLSTALEATFVTAEESPPGAGLRSEIIGWVEASAEPESLGHIDLIKVGGETPALEVTPDFSGWQAATYELTLFHENTVVSQNGDLSGSPGRFLVGPADLTLEWLNDGLVVLTGVTGVSVSPSNGPEGQVYPADTAVFRAENPVNKSEGIHAVTWTPQGLDTFKLTDARFTLQGWRLGGRGMVTAKPWISSIDLEDLGSNQPWNMNVAISQASSWSMSMDASGVGPSSESFIEVSASVALSGTEQPEEWAVLISSQEEAPESQAFPSQTAKEGQTLNPWQISFDLALPENESQTIRILNQGMEVASLSGGSDLFALFQTTGMPGLVTAGMAGELSHLLTADSTWVNDSESSGINLDSSPALYLSFPAPIQITLGGTTFQGDQVIGNRAATQASASVTGAIELSNIQITAADIPAVMLQGLLVELISNQTATLACQTTVTQMACRPSNALNNVEYRFVVDQPLGSGGACLQISASPNSALTNHIPSLQQGASFDWSFCRAAGTSCQTGFTAQYSGPTEVLQSQAILVQGSPQGSLATTTINTTDQVLWGLPPCPNSIQICDDEDAIFADNFECGLGRWSTVVGAVP